MPLPGAAYPRVPLPPARDPRYGAPMEHRIRYKVLPAGVDPDDYRSEDLETHEVTVDIPVSEPGVGPTYPEVERALRPLVSGGDEALFIRFLDT